jgi:putative flavoprotein involved in K+ transport
VTAVHSLHDRGIGRADHDVVVVGAGQAGLAIGRQLQQRGMTPLLLDANPRVGDAWRNRWDSLTLFTPRRQSSLPGMRLPGDPDGYATKDEVADYLEAYASAFSLDVHTSEPVTSLTADRTGGYIVHTPIASYRAPAVVVASGPFASPRIPAFATDLPATVTQLHSSVYRNPAQLPDGPVVVVGAGNSGVQIAHELAATHPAALAVGTDNRAVPQRLLGRDLFWWLERSGMISAGRHTRRGRAMARREMLIGTDLQALFSRVERLPRAVGTSGDGLTLSDGAVRFPRTVVWATGFRPSYPWLHLPVCGQDGAPRLIDDTAAAEGLHFIGLPWQRTRGSGLLGWVGEDATLLAERVARELPVRRALPVPA